MRACPPHVDVPGDNNTSTDQGTSANIMRRTGELIGMNDRLAVWRFGFTYDSEAGRAYGVSITEDDEGRGFLWVLATRKTGMVREMRRGYALDLPKAWQRVVID